MSWIHAKPMHLSSEEQVDLHASKVVTASPKYLTSVWESRVAELLAAGAQSEGALGVSIWRKTTLKPVSILQLVW